MTEVYLEVIKLKAAETTPSVSTSVNAAVSWPSLSPEARGIVLIESCTKLVRRFFTFLVDEEPFLVEACSQKVRRKEQHIVLRRLKSYMSFMLLRTPISVRVIEPLLSVSNASKSAPASAAESLSKSAAATTFELFFFLKKRYRGNHSLEQVHNTFTAALPLVLRPPYLVPGEGTVVVVVHRVKELLNGGRPVRRQRFGGAGLGLGARGREGHRRGVRGGVWLVVQNRVHLRRIRFTVVCGQKKSYGFSRDRALTPRRTGNPPLLLFFF